jgi:CelD/BcsL family acetyltransferase involved in cellulose biosynthesis
VLEQLRGWKADQYRRRQTYDRLAIPWLAGLLAALVGCQSATFAGALSALYAGGVLVAAHLGMRSRTTWHYWFPAYDPNFRKYQPGLVLLVELARHAAALHLTRLDLSSGNEAYKQRLADGAQRLAKGVVEVGPG